MAEHTLTVPAKYVDSLRSAVISEVGFWHGAIESDMVGIKEARETARDEALAGTREGDMGDHQRALAESGALVAQLPAPGSAVDVDLQGRPRVLESLAEEAARTCLADLSAEAEFSPLDVAALQRKVEELAWWTEQYELYGAARMSEQEAVA